MRRKEAPSDVVGDDIAEWKICSAAEEGTGSDVARSRLLPRLAEAGAAGAAAAALPTPRCWMVPGTEKDAVDDDSTGR